MFRKKQNSAKRVYVLNCVLVIIITVFFVRCTCIKNSEPPEYIIIYEEDVQFTGVVPPLEAAFPYTETYSLNAENFYKISEHESDKWHFYTDGIEYKYVKWEKKYCLTVQTSFDDPSKWIVKDLENLSACAESWEDIDRKEILDPDYKCKVYYTPVLPEDYNRIVPLLKQMDIVKNKTVKITVWEFGDGYFHISVKNSDGSNRNDAIFRNDKCLAQHLPKRSNIKNMNLRIRKKCSKA